VVSFAAKLRRLLRRLHIPNTPTREREPVAFDDSEE